jgi:hypothetical protein
MSTPFSINPTQLLGGVAQGITGLPIIIGLPSYQAPVPTFVLGVTTEEKAMTSNTLPGLQLSSGDLFLKSARNAGEYSIKLIISETPNIKSQVIKNISETMQQISAIASSFAVFGGVIPNLSGLSSNFAVAQISTLRSMKDGFQPILLLNSYMPLGSFSTNNPFLNSQWYIKDLSFDKQEAERGVVATITLKEVLVKRNALSFLYKNIIKNLANELLGPGVGSSIGGLL